MKILKNKISVTFIALLLPCISWAQEDPDFKVDPVATFFGAIDLGSSSNASTIKFENLQATNLTISGPAFLSGADADQFTITQDTCGDVVLTPNSSCNVQVVFSPSKFGSKLAMLAVSTDDADSPEMVAFVSSDEDNPKQAERRLPAVIYALNLPSTIDSTTTTNISWSVLGYHADYGSTLALFDCTGVAAGECGNDFSSNFWSSGVLDPNSIQNTSNWSFQGENAVIFDYSSSVISANFSTLNLGSGPVNIVARLYSKSSEDAQAGSDSVSLVVPGNLSVSYYDTQGRRISLTVTN